MPEAPLNYKDARLSDVFFFDELNPVDGSPHVRYAAAQEVWRFRIRGVILDILEAERAHVTLAMDNLDLPPKAIDARALRHVSPSRLALSLFDPLDYRLASLRPYHGARIFVSEAVAEAVRAALKPPSATGGRPEHPAKAWYAKRGFERGDLSIKELQREMQDATGVKPPGETTIRDWERSAK